MAQARVAAIEPTGVPVLILKEGTQRTYGREALRANIMIVRAIAETLRTTYGPKGMDKMLVDSLGDITITNDGATILDKMDVQHPTAKLVVQIAKGQDEEVGDGTKTAVIFAGELLRFAEDLLDKNVHPTIIVSGFKKAAEEAVKRLQEIAEPVDIENEEILKKIAKTSLTSKAVHGAREYLAEMAVKAVKQVTEKRGDKWYIDLDSIQIIKKHGGSLKDSQLIYGIVLDKEVVHPGMPKRVENAFIVLLDAPLEVEKPEIDAEIRITDPTYLKKFLEEEERLLEEMVEKIYNVAVERMKREGYEPGKNAGIVVITQKGIDEVAQHFLAKKGIMAVRRVKRSDLEKLEYATGGKIVSSVRDLTPDDLGFAKLVEERKVGNDKMIFVEGCPNPKAVTILLRGANDMVLDEAERSLNDALHVLRNVLRKPMIVPGGGAVEVELAMRLRKFAESLGGKEQLAVEAYADALEEIPMILAESAGLDALQVLMDLRKLHAEGKVYAGIDALEGKVRENMIEANVIEPILVKEQVLKSATEAASAILKIDDVIAAAPKSETKGKKGGKEE
jgi:thermosome